MKGMGIAGVLIAGLACALPVLADPPPWAPAHGRRAHAQAAQEYTYVYYRNTVPLYYAPQQGLWFWMAGSNWQFGATLPVQYQQYTTGGISIQLGTARPYEQNAYVVQRWGGPRHGHHDGHRRKHHDKHHGHDRD